MQDYLKKHETQAAYTTWAASNNFVTPNVSLIEADGSLGYNPIQSVTYVVTATFDIYDTDSSTRILGENYDTSNISKIEIDNVELPSVVSTYNFSTTGEHTISYTLSDSTIGSGMFGSIYHYMNITISEGITSIGTNAFSDSYLTSINIPNSVTTIGDSAFTDCASFSTCVIGTGIISIGKSVFYNNSTLSTLTIYATTPPSLGDNNFGGEMNMPTIYVPAASVDIYKANNSWSNFSAYIDAIGSNNE